MKKMFACIMLFVASFGVFAADANLFAGGVNATAAGGSIAGSTSQTGAALVGLSFSQGQAQTGQASAAGGVVTPNGVGVAQGGLAGSQTGTASGALGLAAGQSQATSGSGNVAGATGFYRTLGIQVNP